MTRSVFEGVRVLDIGHIVAGPLAASVLADFGADVIKIEKPGTGDSLRLQYPKDGIGLHYKVQARNKKCITLDLKAPKGREIFLRLVAMSDVVIENFRPGTLERLGLDWETLKAINPKLILCRVSGFGQTGPYSARRANGRVGEAFGGFSYVTGEPDGPPMHSQMSLGDASAGTWAALGILMALYWRDAQGGAVGQVIDIGLYEALFREHEQHVIVADQLGKVIKRSGNQHGYNPFSSSYKSKDGGYFSVSAATAMSSKRVLEAMEMADDERFNDWDRCVQNIEEYRIAAATWMAAHTLEEIDSSFQKHGAPGGRVMNAADLMNDPHVRARDMVVTVEDNQLGPIKMQGIVPKLSETPGKIDHPGQALGESNDLIYRDLLGLSNEEVHELRHNSII